MNEPITLKIKRLADVPLPSYARAGDAGLDICAREETKLLPGVPTKVPAGVALEIPEGFAGLVWDRSGLSTREGLKTLGGVIDSGYRGEVMIGMINLTSTPYTVHKHDRIAQLLIQKIEHMRVEEGELSESERGVSGFGSSGK